MHYICIQNISVFELSAYRSDEIRALAARIADAHDAYLRTCSSPSDLQAHAYAVHEFGVSADSKKTVHGNCQRLSDHRFWFEKLTGIANTTRETIAVRSLCLGAASDGKEPYCSDASFSEYLSRQAKRSVTTSTQLRRELEKGAHQQYMTAKALAMRAYDAGYLSLLITLCPDGRYRSSCDQYQGFTFEQAHTMLHGIYEKLIADLSKRGLSGTDFYGVRAIEMHEDGCPHWHLMLYLNPKLLDLVAPSLRASFRKQSKGMAEYFDLCREDIIKVLRPRSARRKDFRNGPAYVFKGSYAGRKGLDSLTQSLRQKTAISLHAKNQYQLFGCSGSQTVIKQLRKAAKQGVTSDLALCKSAHNRNQRQFNAIKYVICNASQRYNLEKTRRMNRYGEFVKRISGISDVSCAAIKPALIVRRKGVTCNSSRYVYQYFILSLATQFSIRAPPCNSECARLFQAVYRR